MLFSDHRNSGGASAFLHKPLLIALSILFFAVSHFAQISPIPWHPKPSGPQEKAPAGKKEQTAPGVQLAGPAEGGRYSMTFDKITTLEDGVYVAEGSVRFEQGDTLLTAEMVTYDSKAETVTATGQAAVDWGPVTVTGSLIQYDMKGGTGYAKDAYAVQIGGEFTVIASEIRRVSEEWYEVTDGTFTSCTAATPPWSMRVTRGRFHVDNYAFLSNARFLVRDAPILYIPYLVWPLKPERSTGFLIPDVGSSNKKGLTISSAFYWAPVDWLDDTTYIDYFEREGFGLGNEFRYALTERDYGWVQGYIIKQKSDDRLRWSLQWTNLQNFSHGWRMVADINLLSDIDFPRDYQRDYTKATVSGTDSKIYLQREWGPYYLNAFVQRRLEYFTDEQNLKQVALPQVEIRQSLKPIRGGLYFGFEASASNFQKEWAYYDEPLYLKESMSYWRADLHPFFEWPLHPGPWLDVVPRIEARATHYSEGVEPLTQMPDGRSVDRCFLSGSLNLAGPRFYRKFKGGGRHIIEPFLSYIYTSQDDDALRIPLFDEVDLSSLDVSRLRYGIRNRVYDRAGELRADVEIYQNHSFKQPLSYYAGRTSKDSPVNLQCRVWPTKSWSTEIHLRYNTLSDQFDQRVLSLTYKPSKDSSDSFFRLSYFRGDTYVATPGTTEVTNTPAEELRFSNSLTMLNGKFSMNLYLERDVHLSRWRQQRGIFWYHGSCYSIGFEGGRREIGDFKESTFRFLVSLKGAGTVLDIYGGTGDLGN